MNPTSSDTSAYQEHANSSVSSSGDVIAFPGPNHRVAIFPNNQREWSTSLSKRFDVLGALPRGWDGYDGRPVSFSTARFAAQLLERLYDDRVPPPSLVPGSDGSLQMEWHLNQYDLEIDVLGPYSISASLFDCVSSELLEVELDTDFSVLAAWIDRLALPRVEGLAAGS